MIHQLEGRHAGGQAEEVSFPLLDGVNENDLQQRKVQVKQHAQNAVPHQHPDYVGMDIGRGDLGEVKKVFEQGWEREPEPSIELLLSEVDSVVRGFLCGDGLSVHKLNGHAIRNAEAFTKLPHVQLVNRFFRIDHPGRIFAALPGRARRSNILFRRHS